VASRWQGRKQTVAAVDGIPDDLESSLPAATVVEVFDGKWPSPVTRWAVLTTR